MWGIRWESGTVPQLYGEFLRGSPFTKARKDEEPSQSATYFLKPE